MYTPATNIESLGPTGPRNGTVSSAPSRHADRTDSRANPTLDAPFRSALVVLMIC